MICVSLFLTHAVVEATIPSKYTRHSADWFQSEEVGRIVVKDPNAPILWARFYEIETNRPFFCDRDGIRKYSFNEIGHNRRNGYRWYGGWGKEVAEAYEKWRQQWFDTGGENL
jgi:PelA/Pel-15E family pectate lyase